MTGAAYWRRYCMDQGLTPAQARVVVRSCEARGSFADIDERINAVKRMQPGAQP